MTLSLIPFVRSFVTKEFFSKPKEFQWCFKKVSRMFEVLRVFQDSFKNVSSKFYGCLQKISRKFQGCFLEE